MGEINPEDHQSQEEVQGEHMGAQTGKRPRNDRPVLWAPWEQSICSAQLRAAALAHEQRAAARRRTAWLCRTGAVEVAFCGGLMPVASSISSSQTRPHTA